MLKKRLVIIIPWIFGILALACIVVLVFVLYSSKASFLKLFYDGSNAVLGEDYYSAADSFHNAMVLEPKNVELEKHIVNLSQEAKRKMSTEEYRTFIDYLYYKCPIEDIETEQNNLIIDDAMKLIDEGEYQSAFTLVTEMNIDQDSLEVRQFYRNIYLKLTQLAIETEDYEDAFSLILKAIDMESEKEKYQDDCQKIAIEYIRYCENKHKYDGALRAIDRVKKYYGNENEELDKMYDKLQTQKAFYETLVAELDELYEVYRNDPNNDALIKQHIYRVYRNGLFRYEAYSSALLLKDEDDTSNSADGKGVCAYWKNNILYIFCGKYEEGIKTDEGILFEVLSDSKIRSYSGEWSNNVLNGNVITTEDYTVLDTSVATDTETIQMTIACDLIMNGVINNGLYEGEWNGYTSLRGKEIASNTSHYFRYVNGYILNEDGIVSSTNRHSVSGLIDIWDDYCPSMDLVLE